MKKLLKKLATIAAAIVAAFGAFSFHPLAAHAEDSPTAETTSVMEDLQADATFSKDAYPSKTIDQLKAADEELLQVIRIGESANAELYVYVYQPSDATKEIVASKILIGQTASDNVANVYPLKLISTDGVFDKYFVDGLNVLSSFEVRLYQITSIFRPFDASLDAETGNDNVNSNMAVPVGQTWYARNSTDGKIEYAHTIDKVITVTDEWHGEIMYSDGLSLLGIQPFTISHFIAFTTDRKIEELLKAEITYVPEQFDYVWEMPSNRYYGKGIKEMPRAYARLDADQTGGNDPNWLGHKYEWKRINTIEDFIALEGEALSSSALAELNKVSENSNGNGAFVLRFKETPYSVKTFTGSSFMGATFTQTSYETIRIKDVAIIKLTFRTNGDTYTLGVVDSMTTSDNNPDGNHGFWEGILLNIKDGFNDLQKAFRMISLLIGACLMVGLLGIAIYGIVTLINWIRESRKNSGGTDKGGGGG